MTHHTFKSHYHPKPELSMALQSIVQIKTSIFFFISDLDLNQMTYIAKSHDTKAISIHYKSYDQEKLRDSDSRIPYRQGGLVYEGIKRQMSNRKTHMKHQIV